MSEAAGEAAEQAGSPDTNGLALDLAMEEARKDQSLREDVAAFLRRQSAMVDLQQHHLVKQFAITMWEKRLGLLLRISTAVIGLAFAAGLGLALWNAAHSDGLVIESFAVPPDLATKGFTGDVVATSLLDKLSLVQDASPNQSRPGRSLSGGFGDDIKVEIPETGISVADAWRFLRRWLGHETHVSGEVVQDEAGLAVMVRIDGRHAARYAGPQTGLDSLMLKAAEHVVDVTQPALYGTYLTTLDPPQVTEAVAVLQRGAADLTLPADDRARALNNLSLVYGRFMADDHKAAEISRQAIALAPEETPIAHSNLANVELALGHPEAALQLEPVALRTFLRDAAMFFPNNAITIPAYIRGAMAMLVGDHVEVARQFRIALAADSSARADGDRWSIAWALARQHDGGAARAWQAATPPPAGPNEAQLRPTSELRVAVGLQQWPRVIALAPAAEKAMTQTGHRDVANFSATQLRPWTALAKAMTGDLAGAETLIAATPGDSYDCVRVRGLIASEARQWGRADYWFALAVAEAPSIPFAYEDWGRSLLARGKPDDAVEKFKSSNAKGPHFADPLEGWGEALMAKNQSHLAGAKFEEANKYAPNWGRLHLKWGEALAYSGKSAEAKAQFARAAALDLTPSEKSELGRFSSQPI